MSNITFDDRQKEMNRLFSEVQDQTDWRAPIDAWVSKIEVDKYIDAIQFFTATTAKQIETRFNSLKGDTGTMVRLVSEGYRNGPAGDH